MKNKISNDIMCHELGGVFLSKILDLVKGAIMGIANVIPGLSGGTLAVAIGI